MLAIRSLRKGIGSMDYIHTLLIMEDDLDEVEDLGEFGQSSTEQPSSTTSRLMTQDSENHDQAMASVSGIPDWCVCGRCRPMPQEVQNTVSAAT